MMNVNGTLIDLSIRKFKTNSDVLIHVFFSPFNPKRNSEVLPLRKQPDHGRAAQRANSRFMFG